MTIFCKLCHQGIRSAKPDLDAQSEVLEAMGTHLGAVHRKDAVELATLLTAIERLAATYLLVKDFVEIPVGEKALFESFAENQEALIQALGLDKNDLRINDLPKSSLVQ